VTLVWGWNWNFTFYLEGSDSSQQFNVQSLAVNLCTTRFNTLIFSIVLTSCLCVLYGSKDKQRLLPYTALTGCFSITEVESIYCSVRAEASYKRLRFAFKGLIGHNTNFPSWDLSFRWLSCYGRGPEGGSRILRKVFVLTTKLCNIKMCLSNTFNKFGNGGLIPSILHYWDQILATFPFMQQAARWSK
jgi:hypothetical protein